MRIDIESYHSISVSLRSVGLDDNDDTSIGSTFSADCDELKTGCRHSTEFEKRNSLSVSFDLSANQVREIDRIACDDAHQQELWYSPKEFAFLQQELSDSLHQFLAQGGVAALQCERILTRLNRECCRPNFCVDSPVYDNECQMPAVLRAKLQQVYENDCGNKSSFDLVGLERVVVRCLLDEAEERRAMILSELEQQNETISEGSAVAEEAQRISTPSQVFAREIAEALSLALQQGDEADDDSDSDDDDLL